MAKKVCAEPGCPALTDTTRCPAHTRAKDKQRGTRQARGYDAAHDAERAKWKRIIDKTGWPCARCPKRIQPGEDFHLDHNAERTAWLGPSHVTCNLSAAGKARHGR